MTSKEFAAIMQKLEDERAAREQRWAEWKAERKAQCARSIAEWEKLRAEHIADERAARDPQWKLTLREFRISRRAIDDNREAMEKLDRQTDDLGAVTYDLRRALLRIHDRLDRLDGGGAAPA
jgi:hypothetical protein